MTGAGAAMKLKKQIEKPEALVGKVVHDRFRIVAPIARGGMGAIYKAEQAPLGRLVAIKVLSPKHDEEKDPEFRKRFFLEAATVAKLSHPNTVTIFDYGQSDGLYFIAMELIDGETLKKALRRDKVFSPARAIHITKQICRSLREAHRLGVIHRDMKPGNVMLMQQGDQEDYVKVLDFGLVKDIENPDEDLTQAGVFMGSPKYMSPEQIQGEHVDGRSDIYAIGVMLYEMLTGRPPFVREKQVQILMDHINAPVPPMQVPSGHPPIPAELEHIVRGCLAKDREQRFANIEELLLALKNVAIELRLSMVNSLEMGLTGEFPLRNQTPISGIQALRLSGAMPPMPSIPPAPASVSPSGETLLAEIPDSQSHAISIEMEMPNPKRGMFFGAGLAVVALAAAALGFFVFGTAEEPVRSVALETAASATLEPVVEAATAESAAVSELEVEPVEDMVFDEAETTAIHAVLVELTSVPSGATVRLGDTEYGQTPTQIELTGDEALTGAELSFEFSRRGFRPATVTATVGDDDALNVQARLQRLPRRRSRRTATTAAPAPSLAGYRDSPY